MKKGMMITLTMIAIAWVGFRAVFSFFTVPTLIAASLAQSVPADHTDATYATILRQYLPISSKITVMYLNGIDGGDNYYRTRYALYPVHFIDYWSWQHPNAGGYVWNTPRFSTAKSLRHLFIKDHVDYVIAIRNPKMLSLLPYSHAFNYLFRVDHQAVNQNKPFADTLIKVMSWS